MRHQHRIPNGHLKQRTLREAVTVDGIGLHTGRKVCMTLEPAPANSGIVFERADLPGKPLLIAKPETIVHSMMYTGIEEKGVRVSTVEHLLAAFLGLGLDNVGVVLDSEEVPILDGSALPFVRLIQEVGVRTLGAFRTWLRLTRPLVVREGDRSFQLLPARSLSVECTLDYDHPLISDQKLRYRHTPENFQSEIAPARTFGFLAKVKEMRKAGLAKGGSLHNAVVIDTFSVLNPEGLRFPNEFVRHKILDILGDLALLGGTLNARVVAHKSGHRLHHSLVRELIKNPSFLVQVQATPGGGEQERPFGLNSFPVPSFQRA